MSDKRVSVEQVMPGVRLHPLPEDVEVGFVFALMKVRYSDGDEGWSYRTSERPNLEELYGALRAQMLRLEHAMAEEWSDEDA